MSDQLEIPTADLAPEVAPEEIERLCSFLAGRGWVTRRVIEAEIGMDERKIRAIAEHSDGRILSGPGSPGYKLFTPSTEIAEADMCACKIESQIKKMMIRTASIRRRIHRYGRSAINP